MTAAQRRSLPKSDFAVPSKAPGSGSYPISDKKRARAALSYGARFASPSELSKIKAAVHRKFPSIGHAGKPVPMSSMA
jgi:hypothetical protein